MSKMDYPDIASPSWRPRKPKKYHYGTKVNANGDVSALCFDPPRAINIGRASWTNRKEAVTCPKCKKLLGNHVRYKSGPT